MNPTDPNNPVDPTVGGMSVDPMAQSPVMPTAQVSDPMANQMPVVDPVVAAPVMPSAPVAEPMTPVADPMMAAQQAPAAAPMGGVSSEPVSGDQNIGGMPPIMPPTV